MDLGAPLRRVPGVGPARASALSNAGLVTVRDLLFHLPVRYEDRRQARRVAELVPDEATTVRGWLRDVRRLRTRRRGFSIVRSVLDDGTGQIPVVWFNRPYLAGQAAGEGEGEWILHGKVREGKGGPELLNPSCEPARGPEALHAGQIVPVYPSAGSVGPAALRRILDAVLGEVDLPAQVQETLPAELLERYHLPSLGEALEALHRPGPDADAGLLERRRSPAHLRLIFGELLELQLALALLRRRELAEPRRLRYRLGRPGARLEKRLRELPPFPLTAAQERAVREILADLRAPHPMLRLLQGDVGSGKTVVAALALAAALENGYQGAFMAPTEMLAEQHFASLERLLGGRYRLGLFTGSRRDPALLAALAAGEVQLAVGTHALIQDGVAFQRLALAVVDEQHRFGVIQRGLLRRKGERPDLLVITATPIPRSLALAAYGDLPVSVLDEMPPGRPPVETRVVPAARRRQVYKVLREDLMEGGRAYVVFPLIEESGQVAAASLTEMGERVRRLLSGIPSAVVHGRMPAAERERAMRAFATGEARVLIATTVVEVGVDVPEATWMVIESAERFGLAQLHQLRGRVGRGTQPSRCLALYGPLSDAARRRLEVFQETTDGFVIAQADLEMRGPGDILGTRQAGLPALRVADPVRDFEWLERARDVVGELLVRLGEPGWRISSTAPAPCCRRAEEPGEENGTMTINHPPAEPLRVLLVANTLPPRDVSGVGEQVLQLAAGLRDAGCEVEILGRGPGGVAGPKVLFPLFVVPALRRALARFRPHVVQVHESDGGLAALAASVVAPLLEPRPLVAALLQVSYVEELRAVRPLVSSGGRALGRPGGVERRFRLGKAPLQILLGWLTAWVADVVLAPSAATAGELRRDYGVAEVEVVPNVTGGLEIEPPRDEPGEAPSGYLLFVGRLRIRKGVEVLLEALRDFPGARLLIAGDGEHRGALERKAAELDLGPAAVFLGRCDASRVRGLLRHAAALVVPSIYEGMPLVVLEAMEAGVPVVASRVSGIPEVVEDGRTGWLVEPEDPAALAAALAAVLNEDGEARRRGEAGRLRVEERFRPAKAAARWLELMRPKIRESGRGTLP
ncbi:MAG TPA: ATP-dependent DNA helicase RecG [Thermoanaerobaculia bacterium]|nr:ATP-dependent DNA helicase RecG [Thermoanaerobaculia bacterium]